MWIYEKKLQYPVNIKEPNAALAKIIITQYGGPYGILMKCKTTISCGAGNNAKRQKLSPLPFVLFCHGIAMDDLCQMGNGAVSVVSCCRCCHR